MYGTKWSHFESRSCLWWLPVQFPVQCSARYKSLKGVKRLGQFLKDHLLPQLPTLWHLRGLFSVMLLCLVGRIMEGTFPAHPGLWDWGTSAIPDSALAEKFYFWLSCHVLLIVLISVALEVHVVSCSWFLIDWVLLSFQYASFVVGCFSFTSLNRRESAR